jgi:hypothetical protein
MLDEGKETELPHAEAHPEPDPQIGAQEPPLAAYPSMLEIGSSSDEASCVCTAIEQGLTPPKQSFRDDDSAVGESLP